jgi:hypothetical protein
MCSEALLAELLDVIALNVSKMRQKLARVKPHLDDLVGICEIRQLKPNPQVVAKLLNP